MNSQISIHSPVQAGDKFKGQSSEFNRRTEDFCKLCADHPCVMINPDRAVLVRNIIHRREAIPAKQGFLFTCTPEESTGRSPLDTYMVCDRTTENTIDGISPNNRPLEEHVFQNLWQDGLAILKKQLRLFFTERVIGADPTYALPVKTITDSALTSLFTLNMFRPMPCNIEKSPLAEKPFNLLVLPYHKIDPRKYSGQLRSLDVGETPDMVIAMNFEQRRGLVIGSACGGRFKKLMFTVMNYYLPFLDILHFHCSASEDAQGNTALFLGLSGTGKTSLSTDPCRLLLGDDEHGWSNNQAMLWLLMVYTSKLAGTETGIVDPVSVFSRFFGEPFMPLLPEYHASLLGEKLQRHAVSVFLLNTGWRGGREYRLLIHCCSFQ